MRQSLATAISDLQTQRHQAWADYWSTPVDQDDLLGERIVTVCEIERAIIAAPAKTVLDLAPKFEIWQTLVNDDACITDHHAVLFRQLTSEVFAIFGQTVPAT